MYEAFKDEKCTICEKKFDADSDVVVCPECGAPYHRNCYDKQYGCFYSDKHGEYEWKSESRALKEHFLNMEEAMLAKEEHRDIDIEQLAQSMQIDHFSDPEQMIEEVRKTTVTHLKSRGYSRLGKASLEEVCAFVGKNVFYYLPRFCRMEKEGGTVEFNFAAFVFFPFHCFYRRMNLFGAIMTLISLAALFTAVIASSVLEISRAGTMYIGTGVMIAMNIFSAMFSNRIYYRIVLKKIEAVKNENPQATHEETLSKIAAEGRPSLFAAIAFPVAIFVICSIAFMFINHQL